MRKNNESDLPTLHTDIPITLAIIAAMVFFLTHDWRGFDPWSYVPFFGKAVAADQQPVQIPKTMTTLPTPTRPREGPPVTVRPILVPPKDVSGYGRGSAAF